MNDWRGRPPDSPVPAPEGHDCRWRVVEVRKDALGDAWARDECEHGWSGEWFRRDGEPGVAPWTVREGDDE